ncbi:MAG: ABC transporter ATP-binding protein [Adlercreutzia sp.]
MEGLSAAIPAGAVTSIVGPNGCGKSTLVKLAAGLLRPAAGRVEVAGRDTASLASRERAHLMAVLAQTSRVPPMTVEALVACGRHPHLGWGGRLGPTDRAAVEAAMERAGVAVFRNHDLHQLSGGERQRAHVARTLAQDTDLIVLDEPTTYLDISACHDLMALVRDLNRREGKTVAMVIHDLDLALRYSDYLVVMRKGRVAAQGPTDEVLASGAVGDAFQMDICPHDRPRFAERGEDFEGRAETERGYVLYPRRR